MVVIPVVGSVEESQNEKLLEGCVSTAGSGALDRIFLRACSGSLGAIMMKFYEE
jgi:hypothetical protein